MSAQSRPPDWTEPEFAVLLGSGGLSDDEVAKVDERIGFAKAKLAKPDFAERAPAEIVAKERERLVEQEAVRAKLVASLGWFDDAGR